ncbi:Ribonuclease HII [uncultured archaeon]|nr:Ribonuclease HII [uncultured archaeon]
MLKLGIDDAGRGPVIGPMVLAGVLIDEATEDLLKREGVKDSKQLTQKRREFLENLIKEKAETFEIVVVYPDEIDEKTAKNQLNDLEAIACAKIINKINKGYNKIKVLVDCPSVSIAKWQDSLKLKIENLSNLDISCEHKADQNHVSVSAASILAKCVREKEMAILREKYGREIGSGYTSDPLTQRFIERYSQKYKDDGIFRKSWVTWKQAQADVEQKKLF